MKENVERSDPVLEHVDVTPEQLDSLHAKCNPWHCEGYARHRAHLRAARVARSLTSTTESLQRVTAALQDVQDVARAWTQRRDLQALESLQAGLQHQRINPTFQ